MVVRNKIAKSLIVFCERVGAIIGMTLSMPVVWAELAFRISVHGRAELYTESDED